MRPRIITDVDLESRALFYLREADDVEPGVAPCAWIAAVFFVLNVAPDSDPIQPHARYHVTPAATRRIKRTSKYQRR